MRQARSETEIANRVCVVAPWSRPITVSGVVWAREGLLVLGPGQWWFVCEDGALLRYEMGGCTRPCQTLHRSSLRIEELFRRRAFRREALCLPPHLFRAECWPYGCWDGP